MYTAGFFTKVSLLSLLLVCFSFPSAVWSQADDTLIKAKQIEFDQKKGAVTIRGEVECPGFQKGTVYIIADPVARFMNNKDMENPWQHILELSGPGSFSLRLKEGEYVLAAFLDGNMDGIDAEFSILHDRVTFLGNILTVGKGSVQTPDPIRLKIGTFDFIFQIIKLRSLIRQGNASAISRIRGKITHDSYKAGTLYVFAIEQDSTLAAIHRMEGPGAFELALEKGNYKICAVCDEEGNGLNPDELERMPGLICFNEDYEEDGLTIDRAGDLIEHIDIHFD